MERKLNPVPKSSDATPDAPIGQGGKKKRMLDDLAQELKASQELRNKQKTVVEVMMTAKGIQNHTTSDFPDPNTSALSLSNLAPQMTLKMLFEECSPCGPIGRLNLDPPVSSRDPTKAVVVYMTRESAEKVVACCVVIHVLLL